MLSVYRRLKTLLKFHSSVMYNKRFKCSEQISDYLNDLDKYDTEYNQLVSKCFKSTKDHDCFIIHPYVKWGPQKVTDTSNEKQIEEAVSLIKTLEPWSVCGTLAVPLENLDKKQLFGTGTLQKLKMQIRSNPSITAVFANVSTLQNKQQIELERVFCVPIFDRYKIVMQILRLHATSKHAKLQVALAEMQYLQANIKNLNVSFGTFNLESRRLMLQEREQKIKSAIKKLQVQREVLRKKRRDHDFPVVAVVGYTNSGKTSLIKTLTGDNNLIPRDQLFATLDVTHHAGLLPSNLKVLYVDTVGFIANIPTNLIECFTVTLEDALFADVILHVEDLSSEDLIHQRNHVQSVLKNLGLKTGVENVFERIITVGNKCDKLIDLSSVSNDVIAISAKTAFGVNRLQEELEKKILSATGRLVMTMRVPNGGDEIRWLYKNATVTTVTVDKDTQYQKTNVIITKASLEKFKSHFVNKR